MAITPADFNASISPSPISVTVGFTGNVNLSFSNTSLTERGYNLKATLTVPDGVSYDGGAIPPTSIVDGPGGTLILTWINIKDLAPNEIGYQLGVVLKADEFFRATGLPVPFDVPLTSVDLIGTVDTLPRGNDDPGNVEINKFDSSTFIPLRYTLTKAAPGKIPKGAGLLSPITAPLWPYQYTLTIENNSREPSTVTLIDDLPNGVRYLNALLVTGPDSVALSSPTVTIPSAGPGCQDFVTIDWGTVELSPFSENTIVFDAAIWDNYTVGCTENSGGKIPHMAPMQNTATLTGLSGPVQGITVTSAMDITIDKSAEPSPVTDVAVTNNYTLTYRVNQYDNVGNVIITDTISDGQEYNVGSASLLPVNPNPPRNIDGTTTLTWNLGLLTTGTTGSITFNTTTSTNYFLGGPVVAADGLSNDVIINGINQTTITPTPDSSSASLGIAVSSIKKEIINYFYKDGTPKTSDVVAPGDGVEFRITYSAVGITAEQRDIQVDEYAPPNMGPLTAALPVTYGGTLGTSFAPVTVAPNGLRWFLGTVPGNTLWTADFIISVANIDFVGVNNNLAKLAGINTQGFAYSSRDQVEVKFGQPNITFAKTVTGPNVNAIKAGENYTYSVTISNPQNLTGNVTDAFEMDFTDVIPTGLIYTGTYSVTGTGTHTTPIFTGQNVSMTINKLAPGESLTLNYTVLVSPTVVSGQSYINNAVLQRPYSQPDRSYQFPGAPFTTSATLKALGITMTKLVAPILAKIGDIVTYILQVKIPLGTTAFNVKVTDNFPIATQNFIGNATKDGLPIVPTVVGGLVTFPTIPFVDATADAVTIIYSFDVRVVNGTNVTPFIDNQTDNATVAWDIDNVGTPAVPFNISAILQVRTPNLIGRKEQRNVTSGGAFTTTNVNYNVGDVIQYRITVTNTGAESAFNSVITDILNPLLSFNAGSIITTNGSASALASTITWNIPVIAAGASDTITFNVTTLTGVGADGRIPDNASFIYNTNNNGFGVSYGPAITNTVQLVAQAITILKTASPTQGEIGDNITYTIVFTVPNGTIAYTPILTDILPVGQTYIGPATRQDGVGPIVGVVPTVVGQIITFPTNPNIDASLGTRTLTYTFIARITSATQSAPFQETQTDTANINWGRTPVGNRVNRTSTANVTARTPNITILKEQRNVSTGGSYTTSNIVGFPGDIIYYRFTITSNGASPAFNINLTDILSSKITFIGGISGPTAGTVTPPLPGPGGTLAWNIPQLNNGSNAVYEFQISINNGIGAGDSIPDSATSTYDSNDVNPIIYNQNSNQVIIDVPLIAFAKTANTSVAALGSTISYTLTVTIPSGVAVNNLTFTDVIPAGQNYVPGTFGGVPLPLGVLVASPNQLIYTDNLPSRVGPLALIYTFDTTVISATTVPPYTQTQRNMADVVWDITPLGPSATVSDFNHVEIRTPHIVALKEQRNVTTGGSFTTAPLLGIAALDVVEYRITLTNDGAGDAYNVVTTDTLDPSLSYLSLTSVSAGVVTPPGPNVNWTINPGPIIAGTSESLVFQVTVNVGPAPGSAVFDQTSTLFDTLDTNPTTLGPALSNEVAFNFNNLEIIKSVDKNAVFIGDIVSYTVAVTVPLGNIAYNVKITDTFPPEQTYNPGSLRVDGVLTVPVTTSPLVTPIIPIIDATAAAVIVLYTFSATVNSIAAGPQQAQVDTATVSLTLDPAGLNPGTPKSSNATVYVTDSDITLVKTQSNNIAGPYVQTPIETSVGSLIYYKLSVTNPGPNTVFNVVVNDTFNPLLQIISVTNSVGASLITGNNLEWAISSIPILTTYNAIVTALVLPGGGSESTIPNFFTAVFDAENPPPEIEYGPKTSNTVLADLPPIQFTKTVSSSNVELGDIITYTLSVIVPNGTIAYNVVVSDILPPDQNYLGNAFIGGNPVIPSQVGQTITFPALPIIDATAGEVTLEFTFDARVVTGNTSPPYTQIQSDNAIINYETDPQGTPGTPLTATLDITVNNPSLSVIKAQSNVTLRTGFTTIPISVNTGDIVRFQLEATSSGASPAYNVVITDVLGPFYQFVGIEHISAGTVTYNALTRTVTWVIDVIPPNTVYQLEFDIQVLPGVGAGGFDTNIATYVYDSNITTPIQFGPTDTNEVRQNYPHIQITKSSNINNAVIGDVVTYTVTLTIPSGTLAYNVQLFDTLDLEQQYNDNATLNGVPVIPDSVDGQLITFPVIPFVDATSGAVIFVYTFEAIIVSANVDPITLIETQINVSNVSWFIDPNTPAEPQSATAQVNVTDSSIQITKLQRNVSREDSFTDMPISGNPNQTVEYSLTVTNNGANPVYNVIITDVLSNGLSFVGAVSVPVGTLIHSGGSTNGVVTWSFSPLNPGDTVTAVFSATIVSNATGTIQNLGSGNFTLNPQDPTRFQAPNSNEVLLNVLQPIIQITGYACATIFTKCGNKCNDPDYHKECHRKY
ncbi:MAG: isopeptide-forming domain-containing fimbrial protein [Clostridium sp.]|uniref:isopeptide-forming domain-containing fimbrial protein n=1 Tax=Clostridium sp. TaxID=1506 RepID=UPI003D6D3263